MGIFDDIMGEIKFEIYRIKHTWRLEEFRGLEVQCLS